MGYHVITLPNPRGESIRCLVRASRGSGEGKTSIPGIQQVASYFIMTTVDLTPLCSFRAIVAELS